MTAEVDKFEGQTDLCAELETLRRRLTSLEQQLVQCKQRTRELERRNVELRKFSQAVAQSSNIVMITDVEGHIEYVNPRFEEITGYTASEIIGRTPRILKSGEHDRAFYRELWETITSGQVWHGEFHNVRKDGSLYWDRTTIAPVYGDSGELSGFIAIKEDVTSLKEREMRLQRQAEDLALLNTLNAAANRGDPIQGIVRLLAREVAQSFGCGSVAIHWLDETRHVLVPYGYFLRPEAEQRMIEVFGHVAEMRDAVALNGTLHGTLAREGRVIVVDAPDRIHRLYAEVAPPEATDEAIQQLIAIVGTQVAVIIPFIVRNKVVGMMSLGRTDAFAPEELKRLEALADQIAGIISRRHAEAALAQYRDHLEMLVETRTSALVESVATLRREISRRQQTEAALREANQLLETIFDHAHVMVAYLDADFNFIRVNRAYAQADGREPAFFVGKNHFDLYPNPENETIFRRVVETGEPHFEFAKPFEYPEHPERGTTYWDWSLVPIKDEQGHVTGLIFTLLDVTERERMRFHLEAIYRLGRELTLIHDVEAIVRRVLEAAHDVFPHEEIDFALVDEQTGQLATHWGIRHGMLQPLDVRLSLADEANAAVEALHQGETIHIPDTAPSGGSRLYVPVKTEDRVLGLLIATSERHQCFSANGRRLMQTLANQAAAALENARLYQEARTRADRMAALNAISVAAISSLELESVLDRILALLCETLHTSGGSILLEDPTTHELVFTMDHGDSAYRLRGKRLTPEQGVAGWCFRHGLPALVNQAQEDPRVYRGFDTVTGVPTRSLICVPLRYRDKITGVLEVVNKQEGNFTPEDLALMEAASPIVATAIENARLYTATISYADRLIRLHQIGRMLVSTLDYATVVQIAATQIRLLFNADFVALLQPDPARDTICLVHAIHGTAPVERRFCRQRGEGLVGWIWEHRQPLLIADVTTDARATRFLDPSADFNLRAMMAVPLTTSERFLGIIAVASERAAAFSHDDLNILQAVSFTLVGALENARAYRELQTLIREREEAQAQLIHSEKMAALGQLMASVAHEINNPLQSMEGCLTLIVEEMSGRRRQDRIERYMSILEDEIGRISAILHRLRGFYRPARDEWRPTDVNAILEDVLALSDKQLQHGQIIVEKAFDGSLLPIQANPDLLKQVFLNLVLNAADAMPEGGTLHVRTAMDRAGLEAFAIPQPVVRIEFRDTGMGIPPEAQKRIFEPFFTLKAKGSGLGLFISYKIITSHHGQISVQSREGEGATFTILLPVEQPPIEEDEHGTHRQNPGD